MVERRQGTSPTKAIAINGVIVAKVTMPTENCWTFTFETFPEAAKALDSREEEDDVRVLKGP